MKSRPLITLTALMLALGLSGLSASAQDTAEWTFMQYLFLDNDLEPQIMGDVIEMTNVGSTADVNLVAQVDRAEGYETRYGDWTDTRRYLLPRVEQPVLTLEEKQIEVAALIVSSSLEEIDGNRQEVADLYASDRAAVESLLMDGGVDPADEAALDRVIANYGLGRVFDLEPLETLGEVDMADPASLVEFMVWSIENFPAERYALVISSHGGGWMGNGPDEDSGGTMLTLPEIGAALAEVRAITGIERFDLVGFDACLMGQLEVYAMLAPHAAGVIAAEEVIPGQGWEYTTPLTALVQNPDMDGVELGTAIVDAYMDYYAGPGARTQVDLHLIDPTASAGVIDALTAFAATAEPILIDALSDLGNARINAQIFGGEIADVLTQIASADLFSSVDLIDLMTLIAIQPQVDPAIAQAAQDVIDAVNGMVVYSRADDQLPGANGVAIYFPLNLNTAGLAAQQSEIGYTDSTPALAAWNNFLATWMEVLTEQLPPDQLAIAISDVVPPVLSSIYDPPVLVFDTVGSGVSSMTFSAILQREDGTQIMLDYSPIAFEEILEDGTVLYTYPTGESLGNQFTWNVEMPVITDGVNAIPALLEIPAERAATTGYVSGVIQEQDGSGETPASVIFDLATRTAVKVYAISAEGAPFEIEPLPGARFIPYWLSFDAEGNPAYVPADTHLTFDVQPFSYAYAPAESGTYRLTLRIQDYAGNTHLTSADVTVDNAGLDPSLRGFKVIEWGLNFLFPWGWSDPALISGDPDVDGDEQYVVTSPDEAISLYVSAFADSDLDATVGATVELLESLDTPSVQQPIFYDALGFPGYVIYYQYSIDGDPRIGTILVIEVSEIGRVFTIDIDAADDRGDDVDMLFDIVINTLSFFEPIESSG